MVKEKSLKILKIEDGYLAIFCASLSPVKLTDEASNFLITTDSTMLESLSLYLVSKRLRKTLVLSHLLLRGCHWMTTIVCWGSCGSFVLTRVLSLCFGSLSRPEDPQLWYF